MCQYQNDEARGMALHEPPVGAENDQLRRALEPFAEALAIAERSLEEVGMPLDIDDDHAIDPILPNGETPTLCTIGDLRNARAALAVEANVKVDFVMVPVEPTEAILDAFWHQAGESKEMRSRVHARARHYWRAMIEAASCKQTV